MKEIISFGEMLQRITVPGLYDRDKIDFSRDDYEKSFGGTECNVLIAANTFDIKGTYITSVAKNLDGQKLFAFLDSQGVEAIDLNETDSHDMAKYYFLPNQKNRTLATLYKREDSCFTYLSPKSLANPDLYEKDGIYHTSGVALALNYKNGNPTFEFLKQAKAHNKIVSFDFNFRANLWEKGNLEKGMAKASVAFNEAMKYVDIPLLSDRDLINFLGFSGTSLEMAKACCEKFNCKYVVVRNRTAFQQKVHKVKGLIYKDDGTYYELKNELYFEISERVGGGDAFDGGILTGILKGYSLERTYKLGIHCLTLKHQIQQDLFNDDSEHNIAEIIRKRFDNNIPKIALVVDDYTPLYRKMAGELNKVSNLYVFDQSVSSLEDYDILIGKKLSPELLATANKLKAIFAYKTGADGFPLDLLKERGIKLFNSHANSKAIAEYAFALAMSITNRITEFDHKLRQGIWYDLKAPYWKNILNMKAGIVGFGKIGQEINSILRNSKIKTFTIDRGVKHKGVRLVPTLEELCKKVDIIFIALPSTKATDNMFNKDIFKLLKGKFIVNVGRSNCINEYDLYESLKVHELYGAALDAWDTKPKSKSERFVPWTAPLAELDNIILSPHQAMKTERGVFNYVEDTQNNVLKYLETGEYDNEVDLSKGY
ncbi:MAG: PfkB family carbohydrate kinase [Bacilli bacterium]|nr:PfkB family carbohydrate kinase [Bacilli bacterium]